MKGRPEFRTHQHHHRTDYHGDRQAFHRPHSSLGAVHHRQPRSLVSQLMPLLTVAAPFLICELFKDSEHRSRALRGAAVVGAVAREGAWQMRNMERGERETLQNAVRGFGERGL